MSDIVILGNGKFALELASYLRDIEPQTPIHFIALPGAQATPARAWPEQGLEAGPRYVLGISDIPQRQQIIDRYFSDDRLCAPNFIHPAIRHHLDLSHSRGNVIAADCYLGVNVQLGSWNMINYRCCLGHHSTLGDNNFLSPGFNAGNSVILGSRGYFGLSTVVVPATVVGNDVVVQAGAVLSEMIPDAAHCSSTARQKIVQLV